MQPCSPVIASKNSLSKNFTIYCRSETAVIRYGGTLRIGMTTNALVSQLVMNFIVFVAYVETGGSLTTKSVFTIISLLIYIRVTCLFLTSRAVFGLSEAAVASRRIQVSTVVCAVRVLCCYVC